MTHPETDAPGTENHTDGATPQTPTFAELGLSAPVLEAVTEIGYETPSPIQAAAAKRGAPIKAAASCIEGLSSRGPMTP